MSVPAEPTPPRPPARRGIPVATDGRLELGASDPPRTRRPKLAEAIAGELVRDIVSSNLRPGDHLSPEAAMLEQYGVGRESLREALRLLESAGLITIKRGPGGGPVLAAVDPRYLARTTSLYFHLSGATYDEVLETWQVLEPALAAQVARRPARGEVARVLSPYLWAPGEGDLYPRATRAGFHTALAQLSGSRVMALLLQAVSHMLVDHVAEALEAVELWDEVDREHADIAQAVMDGHDVKAQRLMERHIGRLRDTCHERWPDRILDLVDWA